MVRLVSYPYIGLKYFGCPSVRGSMLGTISGELVGKVSEEHRLVEIWVRVAKEESLLRRTEVNGVQWSASFLSMPAPDG
ncbi:hypothetical protein GW17_00009994 [Ensete ventricosum]|nr:hypothetical protein GW17_00009994 [Ensete ventricosum]RZR97209.1 hypothetical protein BHM03_00026322 [Ensete ventricosum]